MNRKLFSIRQSACVRGIRGEVRFLHLVAVLFYIAAVAGCSREAPPGPPPTKVEIWTAIQPLADKYLIDPSFIYALVAAESNFDPRARNGEARGLMQIKPAAWRTVSTAPYEPAVWDWRANLQAGVEYLAYTRSYLHKKSTFSYPLLLAGFHYGLDFIEDRRFDIRLVEVPDNAIYRKLWSGNLSPVPPPI